MNVTKCRKCGAKIMFFMTKKGKMMPVDVSPVRFRPGGGPEVYIMENGEVKRGTHDFDNGTEKGYTSHFATCPYADSFRKRGKTNDQT